MRPSRPSVTHGQYTRTCDHSQRGLDDYYRDPGERVRIDDADSDRGNPRVDRRDADEREYRERSDASRSRRPVSTRTTRRTISRRP